MWQKMEKMEGQDLSSVVASAVAQGRSEESVSATVIKTLIKNYPSEIFK